MWCLNTIHHFVKRYVIDSLFSFKQITGSFVNKQIAYLENWYINVTNYIDDTNYLVILLFNFFV